MPHAGGKRKGAKYARLISQGGRHNVLVDMGVQGRQWDVAMQELPDFVPQQRKELDLLHDATSKDDALWRQYADVCHERQGQVTGLQAPGRVIRG